MHAVRSTLLLALLPLFAACQLLTPAAQDPNAGLTRMQGELIGQNGQLLFQPCQGQRRYVVKDSAGTSLLQEAATLASTPGKLYVDIRGGFTASSGAGSEGVVNLQQVYRLSHADNACSNPDFKRLQLMAGQPEHWEARVNAKGIEIARPGQPVLALPVVEETLPGGRLNFSSEANGQRVELWVAPQRCVDSTGTVSALTAELRLNDQVQHGCAWFGGARHD